MVYSHYFWDFDGTLYDTYGLVTGICRDILDHYGVKANDQDILRCAKASLSQVVSTFCPDKDPGDVLGLYNQLSLRNGLKGMHLYPGAERFLRASRLKGAAHYLYTHRDGAALSALKRDGLYPLFTDFVTSEHRFASKPAPDALNHLIGLHMLNRSECVMVGDRAMDLDAAKNAEIDGILFDPDGFYADYPARHRFGAFEDMQTLL